jgi:hypothetical protein
MPATIAIRPLALALALLSTSAAAQVAPIDDAEFARLHASLCAPDQGRWQQIPWTIDLLAARDRATRERKPLFLWSMNGHPLGCT